MFPQRHLFNNYGALFTVVELLFVPVCLCYRPNNPSALEALLEETLGLTLISLYVALSKAWTKRRLSFLTQWMVQRNLFMTLSSSCTALLPLRFLQPADSWHISPLSWPDLENGGVRSSPSLRKHPDWERHNLAWFRTGEAPQRVIKTGLERHWYMSAEQQRHWWSEMPAQSPKDTKKWHRTPATVCSPCRHRANDTEVSAAVTPDYRAALLPRLWDSWTHSM